MVGMNPKSTCRSPKIARVVIGSNYLAFHGDPRFQDLIRRAGLPN
jgi:hypothetical protein